MKEENQNNGNMKGSGQERVLSPTENVIYNFPNLGLQTLYALNTNLIILFYVNIIGQPPIFIGAVQSVFVFLAAIFCPVFGVLCDKLHSRFGRKKTFMLISMPLAAIAFVLIWIPPIPTTSYGILNLPILFWFIAVSAIFSLSAVAFQTSYISMIPDLSTEESNRVKISELNMIFMILGGGIGALIPILVLGTSTEGLSRESPDLFVRDSTIGMQIYSLVFFFAVLCSLIFIVGFILMMWKIKEPNIQPTKTTSMKDVFKELLNPLKDVNYKNYLLSFFLMFVGIGMFQVLIINFVTFVLDIRAGEFIILAAVILIAAIGSFVIFDYLSRKLGLKKVMMLCLVVAIVAFTSNLVLLIPMAHEVLLILGIVIVALCLASFVGAMIFPMAIVSSLVDAAKSKSGKNLSGSYMGNLTMSSSLAGSCTILIASIFLQIFGATSKMSYVFVFLFGGVLLILSFLIFRKVNLISKTE